MSEYNIQMNKYNALNAGYDQLYPATKIVNVEGLGTALQNNDPRNWGLGKLIGKYVADLNTHLENGWYYTDASTVNGPVNAGAIVEVSNRDNTIEVQTFRYWIGSGISIKVERLFNGSAWQPWEWVNPPMVLGEEYRTTERYLGKPVYVKLVDFGKLPNATTKIVNFAIENNAQLLECKGFILGGGILPYSYPGSSAGTANVYINKSTGYFSVFVSTDVDLSRNSAYFILKYTKTTD